VTTSWRSRIRGGSGLAAAAVLALVVSSPAHAVPPTNDDIETAAVIGALPYTDARDTTEATTAPGDPNCTGQGPTVWYVFTPGTTIEMLVDTFGSDYDTTLSAYTGEPGALNQIACNDDFQSLQSRVVFTAAAQTTYWIMVGAFASGPGGSLVLTAQELPPRVVLVVDGDPTGAVDGDGLATVSGTLTCSRPAAPVEITGSLRQSTRSGVSLGYYRTQVDCDGSVGWTATVQGQTGVFRHGNAQLQVAAAFIDPVRGERTSARTTETVRLR
jgi:Family of unknown function (DUF6299)